MADAPDLPEDAAPTWDEGFQPPPWSAEPDEDFGPVPGLPDLEAWHVVSHGYEDETPIVCAGTQNWPLWREQALILAAALDTLKVCRQLDQHWTEDFAGGPTGKKAMDVLDESTRSLWTACRAAIAKADGADHG